MKEKKRKRNRKEEKIDAKLYNFLREHGETPTIFRTGKVCSQKKFLQIQS